MNSKIKVCERCDMEMRLIPAGVSRSKGKPYPAFWTCDKRNGGCGATANAGESEGGGQFGAPMAQPSGGAAAAPVSPDRLAAIEAKVDRILELLEK